MRCATRRNDVNVVCERSRTRCGREAWCGRSWGGKIVNARARRVFSPTRALLRRLGARDVCEMTDDASIGGG